MCTSGRAAALGAALLATIPVDAQTFDELPPAAPIDFSLVAGSEAEPLDRIAAQQALQGNVQTEAFKANAIAELSRKQLLYAGQLAGGTPSKGMPVWRSIGPSRARFLQNGVTLTKVIDSGRITSILPHPSDPDTVYVLTSGGGLWKTTNLTRHNAQWMPLTDALVSTSGGAAALGREPATIYLGIGDSFDVEGLIAGVMTTSSDGGRTWGPLVDLVGASSVRDIKVDTTGPADVVWVATDVGLFRSVDGGASVTLAAFDGQSVWSLARTSRGWIASVQAPTSAAGFSPLLGAGTVYLSSDGGISWSPVSALPVGNYAQNTGPGRITVATATPGDPVVYAFAGNPRGNDQNDLYRSADGGQTWAALGVGRNKAPLNPNCQQPGMNLMRGQAYYNQALVVDPSDAQRNTVYIGGQISSAKSIDGGRNWTLTSIWLPGLCPDGSDANVPYVHADFHAAVISRAGGGTLIFGTDGGLAVSQDGGASFDTQINSGLVTHLSQTVVSSTKVQDNTLTGMQDDGTRMRVGGNSGVWNQVVGGDGEGAGWSQANNAVALGSVYYTSIRRYPNPQANPQPFNWAHATNGIGGLDYYPFFTPLATPTAAADPTGLTFFTSTGSKVYRTIDGANSWQTIFAAGAANLPTRVFNLAHNVIGVDPTNANRVAMAGVSGLVFITTDGGATWAVRQARSSANHYPGINVSPSWAPDGTLYLGSAFGGVNRPRVVKSSDGGVSWAAAANGLPDVPLAQLLADPRDLSGLTVYAATWIGVYVTGDGGESWTLLGAGLPNVWVKGMYISDYGLLRVATYGRGVWEIQL